MQRHKVWDPAVRLFHWTLATGFVANALFTNPEKWLHHYVGYTVGGLVAFRILWGFVGPAHARFTDFPPRPRAALDQAREMLTGGRRIHLGHSPLGALMIYNLLLTFAGLAITGYMQTTNAYFGVDWVATVHVSLATWAEISVVAHIAAVAFESLRLRVNLPVSMLTGYKHVPEVERES